MNHLPCLSEAVYVIMCYEVGTPTEVKIKREVMNIKCNVQRPQNISKGFEVLTCGSEREGFKKPSDIDYMTWTTDFEVISTLSQYRCTPELTMILMEHEDLPPGYAGLKILTVPKKNRVTSWLITNTNGKYDLRSSTFRSKVVILYQSLPASVAAVEHGPCATFSQFKRKFDYVLCLPCHNWPDVALPWSFRCRQKRWPPESVVSMIIKIGCHVVPISSQPSDSERDAEWRISFAAAERQLVYAMSHCQFVCYGFLKLILKELINENDSLPCLTSYSIKTVMFWVIQNNSHLQWIPCNLLTCLWTCFKLLIFWVYKGECPNFFIPQNNMFRVKVVGHAQTALFEKLLELYHMGICHLIDNTTIGENVRNLKLRKIQAVMTNESNITSDARMDLCFCENLQINATYHIVVEKEEDFEIFMTSLQNTLKANLTCYESVTVQILFSVLFRHFVWRIVNKNAKKYFVNKQAYTYINNVCHFMKTASKIGFASELLHLATYYYRVKQYEKSVTCLKIAQ